MVVDHMIVFFFGKARFSLRRNVNSHKQQTLVLQKSSCSSFPSGGAQIFQKSGSHLKLPGVRRVM
jgi:hypothetical protein